MAGTTTNGFPYPESTDFVTDGAQAIEDLAVDVDARMGLYKVIPSGATNGTVAANGDVTVGSAVSSVTVSGAFSASFDNYKILYNGGQGSANTLLYLRLGATTTNYYNSFLYSAWNNTSQAAGATNATSFERFGRSSTTTNNNYGSAELYNPFLSCNTRWFGYDISADGAGTGFGFLNNTTSYTSFIIFPASGTITSGIIRVYGYN